MAVSLHGLEIVYAGLFGSSTAQKQSMGYNGARIASTSSAPTHCELDIGTMLDRPGILGPRPRLRRGEAVSSL